MIWMTIALLVLLCVTLWLMVKSAMEEDDLGEQPGKEEWIDSYKELYEEIKEEELPRGFEDLK